MTPDDAARKALEEAHRTCQTCRGQMRVWSVSPETKPCPCETHTAINRLARAAWEAGFETMIKRSIYEPSWLPPKDPDNRT